jgi:hypothetical protein
MARRSARQGDHFPPTAQLAVVERRTRTQYCPVAMEDSAGRDHLPRWRLVPSGTQQSRGGRTIKQGYFLHDEADHGMTASDARLVAARARVIAIAGVGFHAEAFQQEAFSPGRYLTLIPEPENPHDRNAIGIWDDGRQLQAGYVPRAYTKDVAADLRRPAGLKGVSLVEFRRKPQGDREGARVGLRVLLAPPEVIGGLVVVSWDT